MGYKGGLGLCSLFYVSPSPFFFLSPAPAPTFLGSEAMSFESLWLFGIS